MTTYSVRCRHRACRMRRVSNKHPIEDDTPCPSCASTKGWRIEQRTYNRRGLCNCTSVVGDDGPFPHRPTHPMCDQHPRGFYNQAKRRGVADADIPLEHLGETMKETDDCPF